MAAPFVHPHALCETEHIGAGTRIWAFAHVMKGAVIGRECNIGDHVFIETGVRIGNRVTIKNQAMLWDGVEIGDDVFIGPGVTFTNDLIPRSPRLPLPAVAARYRDPSKWLILTRVANGASLGARSTILPGITVGSFAMIAAGAVVSRPVQPHALVGGVPARKIGWVCRCGSRLEARGSAWGCLSCNEQFYENSVNGCISLVQSC